MEEKIAKAGNSEQMKKLRRQFQELDSDNSGTIEVDELGPLLLSLGVNCTQRQLRKHMEEIDEDQSGTVDWFEFMSFVFAMGDENQSLESRFTKKQLQDMRDTFGLFDRNGDWQISTKELGRMLKLLGQRVHPKLLAGMINEFDADGSGFMEWPEFLSLMATQLKGGDDDEDEYVKAFNLLDEQKRGFLFIKEVADKIMSLLPGEISEQDLRVMALEAKFEDNNLDRLTYKEFVKMMMSD